VSKDLLFILAAPFKDGDANWFCRDCAMLEGALLANPHWLDHIEVRRVAFPRPRADVIPLLGEDNQGLPALVLAEGKEAPIGARSHNGRAHFKDASGIAAYLAKTYGGAGPHP